MLCEYNKNLESQNFQDGVDFTRDDPCIFVVYPPGASGDLLISIIDKHYLRTGCEYYGINSNGRVHLYTTDYEIIDCANRSPTLFREQWFYDLADKLSERNLNYSLLDQVIFGCHHYREEDIKQILNEFPKAQIINIYPETNLELAMMKYQAQKKINLVQSNIDCDHIELLDDWHLVNHVRVLNLRYKDMFQENRFEKIYDEIVNFLELNAKLIRFDYIRYYLDRQTPEFLSSLSRFYAE